MTIVDSAGLAVSHNVEACQLAAAPRNWTSYLRQVTTALSPFRVLSSTIRDALPFIRNSELETETEHDGGSANGLKPGRLTSAHRRIILSQPLPADWPPFS